MDYSDYRLENARRLGLITCNPGNENLKGKAFAEFGFERGYPAEKCKARLYVDAVGVKSVLENFAMLAPRNGEIAIVGVHKEASPFDWVQVSFNNWPRLRQRRHRNVATRDRHDDAVAAV